MRLSVVALLLVAVVAAQSPAPGEQAAQPRPLRIIAFGAHVNDAEIRASGVVARWVAQGHKVKFVAMTHGYPGHNEGASGPRGRAPEVAKCARILGIETQVFDMPHSKLTPSLENRRTVARLIRQWQADVVLGPRPYDEAVLASSAARGGQADPDERYLGVMLDDSAATVVAPFFLPDTPPMPRSPVYLYYENYQMPSSFDPTIVAGFDDAAAKKWKCMAEMPLGPGDLIEDWRHLHIGEVKKDDAEIANKYRERLVALYGAERGQRIRYAEAFELSQHGRQATVDELLQLFPEVIDDAGPKGLAYTETNTAPSSMLSSTPAPFAAS